MREISSTPLFTERASSSEAAHKSRSSDVVHLGVTVIKSCYVARTERTEPVIANAAGRGTAYQDIGHCKELRDASGQPESIQGAKPGKQARRR